MDHPTLLYKLFFILNKINLTVVGERADQVRFLWFGRLGHHHHQIAAQTANIFCQTGHHEGWNTITELREDL